MSAFDCHTIQIINKCVDFSVAAGETVTRTQLVQI